MAGKCQELEESQSKTRQQRWGGISEQKPDGMELVLAQQEDTRRSQAEEEHDLICVFRDHSGGDAFDKEKNQ